MSLKQHIPNLFTIANLLCGCFAVVSAFQFQLQWAAYLVGIAALLDFLDGFVARALQAHSEMGKQLDSLADMVTFGLVPGVMMFQVLNFSFIVLDLTQVVSPDQKIIGAHALERFNDAFILGFHNGIPFIAFLITVFSAIRLAKFNTDIRQTDHFIGLPTPANALLICSIPLIAEAQFGYATNALFSKISLGYRLNAPIISDLELFLVNPLFLCGLTLLVCYLLVSNIPLFALKFKNFSWQDNKIRYVFLIFSALLLILFQYLGIALIVFLYIVLSILQNQLNKQKAA